MNYFPLTKSQQEWKERTAEIAERDIGHRAAEVDRKAERVSGHDPAVPRDPLGDVREIA